MLKVAFTFGSAIVSQVVECWIMLEIGQLICLVANVSLGSVIYMWTISSNCFHTEVMSIFIQPMTLGCFGVHWNAPFRKVSVAWILDILVLYGHLDIVLHWVVLAFFGVGLNPLHGCHILFTNAYHDLLKLGFHPQLNSFWVFNWLLSACYEKNLTLFELLSRLSIVHS